MLKFIIFILFYTTVVQLQSLYRYEIIIDYLELPKSDALYDYGTIRVKKYNRTTYAVNGYCDIKLPYSDDIVGKFEIFSFQGNEYKKSVEKVITKMCTFYKEDKMFVPRVINQTSFGEKIQSCPIEPQRVHFYDLNFPSDFFPVEPPQGEKYRANVTYSLDGKILAQFSVYFSLKKIVEGPGGLPGSK